MLKANKLSDDIDIFENLLVFLYFEDLIHSFSNVKQGYLFCEILLIFVQDSVVKDVVHEEIDELCSTCNLVSRILQLLIDQFHLMFEGLILNYVNLIFELFKYGIHSKNLCCHWSQGVSQFMTDCSVDQSKEGLFLLDLIKQHFIWNINYL